MFLKHSCDIEIIHGNDDVDLLKEIVTDKRNDNQIKCVFIDENMEYMNGTAAAKLVRTLEQEGKIKKTFICSMSVVEEQQCIMIFISVSLSVLTA